jgi:diguanylate cyclase (GGDEF)-like protein
MALHVPTLSLVAVFVTTILSALLLFCWWRDRATTALAWWSAAYFTGAVGMALLGARGRIPPVLSIDIANIAMILGYSFLFVGARRFSGRDTPVTVFLVAPLIWMIARQAPIFADINMRIITISLLLVAFALLTAHEFWRARGESLLSRWPAIVVLIAHAVAMALRVPYVIASPLDSDIAILTSGTFALMAFGTLLYTITLAFILLAMTKERGELRHKTAALIDPLTGLANRRAFLSDADALAERRLKTGEPLTVLLADLDRFKAVNDRFGHAVGDRVLQVFADTVSCTLRPSDLSGRLGGEEFAILLPGAGAADAARVAERIRTAYCAAAASVGGHAVASTVSIGSATTSATECDLSDLLAVADRALYRAKAEGRNRIVTIDCDVAPEPSPSIIPDTPRRPFALALAS